jgi:hypothetical protein
MQEHRHPTTEAEAVGADPMGQPRRLLGERIVLAEGMLPILTFILILRSERFQGIDWFCRSADEEEEIAPLRNGRKWEDFKMTSAEWSLILLARDMLKVSLQYSNSHFRVIG